MKFFSVLFFGVVFFTASTAALAQPQTFLVTTSDVNRLLIYPIDLAQSGAPQLQPPVVSDALLDDILLTAVQGTINPDIFDITISTTNGTERKISQAKFEFTDEAIQEFIQLGKTVFPNQDNRVLQAVDGNSPNTLSDSAMASNRLFSAGTKQTAGANDYFSFVLNADSLPTGAKSTIFLNPNTKTALGASISRDGGMAVQLTATSTSWTLSTRKLNAGKALSAGNNNSLDTAAPAPFSWTVPAYHGYSPDITNAIEVNSGVAGAPALKIRYLVYRAFRGVGTAGQQSQIMIQRIDDATGKPLEEAKPLTPFKTSFQAEAAAFQSLAIAPNGEMIAFAEDAACKKLIFKVAKLVNGAIAGTSKVAAGCAAVAQSPFGFIGFDIIEVSE